MSTLRFRVRRSRAQVVGLAALCGLCVQLTEADVLVDGSLTGAAQAVTGDASVDYLITEDFGARSGNNLFFSFSEFAVATGEVARFDNPSVPTDNLIGRITAADGGALFGRLDSPSSANLWLISPNGWTFGDSALLDVQASINMVAADELAFSDGDIFSAAGTSLPSGLPSSLPTGDPVSATIRSNPSSTISGTGLAVRSSATSVGLYGSDIQLERLRVGSINNGSDIRIRARASGANSRVFFNAAESAQNETSGGSLTLSGARVFLRGDGGDRLQLEAGGQVNLSDSQLNVLGSGTSPGVIRIAAGEIVVDADSALSSAVPANVPGSVAHDIELIGRESIEFSGELISAARAINSVSGDVLVQAPEVSLTNASFAVGRQVGGQAGALQIEASERLSIVDSSLENLTIFADGQITTLRAPQILLDASVVQADGQDTPNGPGILFDAQTIELRNNTNISSDVERGAGAGVQLIASESLIIDNSLITTESFEAATGAPLSVTAGEVILQNGGRLTSDVVLDGRGGAISIAADSLQVLGEDSGVFARSGSSSLEPERLIDFIDRPDFALGDGGGVDVDVDSLLISGGQITVDTFGRGAAGSVALNVAQRIELAAGGRVSSSATQRFDSIGADVLGGGGQITVTAGELELREGGQILSNTDSDIAPGGAITIDATTTRLVGDAATGDAAILALDQGSSTSVEFTGIASNSSGAARGGSLSITGNRLRSSGAVISASASGTGGGGDVFVGTQQSSFERVLQDGNSGILARAQQGNGGNVFLFAEQFLRDVNTVLSADSTEGNSGTVDISAPNLDISGALIDLDAPIVDAADLLRSPCNVSSGSAGGSSSSLTITPAGGRLVGPDGYLGPLSTTNGAGDVPLAAPGCVGAVR